MARYEASIPNETTWVRSVYVYGVLLGSGVAAVVGVVLALVSTLVMINPESGMTGWERVLVGVPTVLEEGVDLAETYLDDQRGAVPDYCTDDLTEDDPDFDYCEMLRESMAEPVIPAEADQAIALVRDETLRQIRHGAIAKLLVGVIVFAVAALVFRRHQKLVALYGKDDSTAAPTVVTTPVPPPPPATT